MTQGRLEEVPCNLCGSGENRVIYHRPYALDSCRDAALFSATTDEFHGYGRIVRCSRCGLAFTNPRPAAADLLRGYAGCSDEGYLSEGSSRSINAHFSLAVIKRFARSGRLLEIGSNVGYFLNAARVDFDVLGLEPSAWACEQARRRFKLDCHADAVESARGIAPGSFDVVAMIDVLEHLADPKGAVGRAAESLRPGGLLYVVTPDIGSLSSTLLGAYWWGLRPAHIHYFDRITLGRLLAEAGFDLVLSKSFGRIFTWGYWASRLRHYPSWVGAAAGAAVRAFDIHDKMLYLDTRDSMEICAVKR